MNDCCKTHLEVVKTRKDKALFRCKVCDRLHWRFQAEGGGYG
jgi:uncharacterized Zn finger protein